MVSRPFLTGCFLVLEGSQPAVAEGDVIGLLLDLDVGSMTVYKNGERLGVMSGETVLSGEYCWAASLHTKHDLIRLESKPPPAAP